MVFQYLLAAALAAEPSTATILARRTGASPADAAALTRQVAARLSGPAFVAYAESQRRLSAFGLSDGTTCGGKPECHAEVGRQLGVQWLVLVSVSQIAQDQSVALELVEVATEQVHERDSLLLPRRGEVPIELLERFAERVVLRVQGSDAPRAARLEPRPGDPSLPLEAPPRSRVGNVLLGTAALAAIGVGVGLLVNGLSLREGVARGTPGDDGRLRSDLTGGQAQAQNDQASVMFGLAGGAAALGLVLGTTAVLTW